VARRDFDPATVKPDGRPATRARLFDPATGGPWRGAVAGLTLGGRNTVLAYGTDTVGEGPRLHVHPYDETFIVVEGRARFFVGDMTLEAAAGDVVFGSGRRASRTGSKTSARAVSRQSTSTTRRSGSRRIWTRTDPDRQGPFSTHCDGASTHGPWTIRPGRRYVAVDRLRSWACSRGAKPWLGRGSSPPGAVGLET
jgi:mannose-6-phosphate isomerase-like protein (cupin superfamily)